MLSLTVQFVAAAFCQAFQIFPFAAQGREFFAALERTKSNHIVINLFIFQWNGLEWPDLFSISIWGATLLQWFLSWVVPLESRSEIGMSNWRRKELTYLMIALNITFVVLDQFVCKTVRLLYGARLIVLNFRFLFHSNIILLLVIKIKIERIK